MAVLHAKNGLRGKVLDLDTGAYVPKVIWLDIEAGLLEALGARGSYLARGRFRFIPRGVNADVATGPRGTVLPPEKSAGGGREAAAGGPSWGLPSPSGQRRPRVVMGAPSCALCRSHLTLPGDDLCVACRARERNQRHRMKAEPVPRNWLVAIPCCRKGCGRRAEWMVSDEVEASPKEGRGRFARRGRKTYYVRAACVARRAYCSWCWQPPRLLDQRGEVIEDIDDVVRPDG